MEITEEDVRQSVSTYILQLGLDLDEVRHETQTLKIKVFRNVTITIGRENRNTASGRLDILVRRDDSLLFIVEIKKPGIDLLEGKEQVVSYARLLLVPLAVVTNGIDTILLDPYIKDGEEITNVLESTYVKNSYRVNVTDDIRYQALQNFIGYNIENLLSFCESQREKRMAQLKGNSIEKDKKYINDLYVINKELVHEFKNFLRAEDRKLFFLHGRSGIGKTNSICYLADLISMNQPVLFYSASLMNRNIREEMEDDFNYHFSKERSFISIIKRLNELLEKFNTTLMIFIDAVDEYHIQNNTIAVTDFF